MPTTDPVTWPADILLTLRKVGGTGDQGAWLTQAIKYATERPGSGITFTHAVLVCAGAQCLEATWPKVRYCNIHDYIDGQAKWMLLRVVSLSPDQRNAVVREMARLINEPYPIGQLVLDGLDVVFHTRFFARGLSLPWWAVCSGSVALGYKRGASYNFRDHQTGKDLPAHAVTPDDLHANAETWPSDVTVVAGSVL